jgi:hypothetical protein
MGSTRGADDERYSRGRMEEVDVDESFKSWIEELALSWLGKGLAADLQRHP